jgi:hypothetical protein
MRTILGVALAMAMAAAAAAASARELTVQEAVAQVQQQTGAKILSAQTLRVGNHKVYRIKILTRDGRVRIVQVRAEPEPATTRRGQ